MYKDFTSLDPAEEQRFLVYEQRMRQDSKKALVLGGSVGGAFLLVAIIVVMAFGGADHSSDYAKFGEEGENDKVGEEKAAEPAAKPPAEPAAEPPAEPPAKPPAEPAATHE